MSSRIGQPDTEADLSLRKLLSSSQPQSFVMLAGAGSGKTTSLVKALSYLEQEKGRSLQCRGQKIACITYTEIAVEEISKDINHSRLFHVSTIHSFLWTIIRPFQADLGIMVRQKIERKIADASEHLAKPKTRESTREKLQEDIKEYKATLAGIGLNRLYRYGSGSNYLEGILGHTDIIEFGTALIKERDLLKQIIASRFPYIFIDESQDTNTEVYNAFHSISKFESRCCLGFFGDPMQKIYLDGIGKISVDESWSSITKPENFRCPLNVLSVINQIRKEDDGLVQKGGRKVDTNGEYASLQGTARMFIFPADDNRDENIAEARKWIAEKNHDPLWLPDNEASNVRVLVIVHRMAANRLGFPNLYSAFNDAAPNTISDGFVDGTSWPIRPFLQYVLPLVKAVSAGKNFEVMQLLRAHCPLFQKQNVVNQNISQILGEVKSSLTTLANMFSSVSASTVGEVLVLLKDSRIVNFDERYLNMINGVSETAEEIAKNEWESRFANCNTLELLGYQNYIENFSPFSTQQGVKGTEFERVLVILDDEEGAGHRQFSYGKYFGFTKPSDTDLSNEKEGKDNVMSRTRRLFYVCCSRAMKDLVVMLFAPDVKIAYESVLKKQIFPQDEMLCF